MEPFYVSPLGLHMPINKDLARIKRRGRGFEKNITSLRREPPKKITETLKETGVNVCDSVRNIFSDHKDGLKKTIRAATIAGAVGMGIAGVEKLNIPSQIERILLAEDSYHIAFMEGVSIEARATAALYVVKDMQRNGDQESMDYQKMIQILEQSIRISFSEMLSSKSPDRRKKLAQHIVEAASLTSREHKELQVAQNILIGQ